MKMVLVAAVLAAASATPVLAASVTEITIKPGPMYMSASEKAIAPDLGKGIQHGVVLIEETERNDDVATISEIAYRLRAKILSPEARGLADVVIPVERGAADLKKWWGRTILPDGTVLELPERELKAQLVRKSSAGKFQELRGALPGVVPGCVIEYGYVVQLAHFYISERVFLQRSWPVLALRYRWVPTHTRSAAYVLSRSEGLAVNAKYDARSVLVTASGLNPVAEEPHMPPLDEARASVTFYYSDGNEKAQEYWDLAAKRVERSLKTFSSNTAAKEVIEALQLPATATLDDKLRAAYAWLGEHVKNTGLMSAEEQEAADQDQKSTYNAKSVLNAHEATSRQFDLLFAGVARALGANANIVYGVDRSDRFWNKSLKSMEQFGFTFVAVRAPGEPNGKFVFVDAGSGLPYGQVPWRATGVSAFMCTAEGMLATFIPSPSPVSNRADTRVTLAFSEDNDTLLAKWARTANGATGVEYRRWLRELDTRQRKETLDRLCGASGLVEVTAAELPGLDEKSGPFQIACELEESNMEVREDIGSYMLPVGGPWWPETPELTAATRANPVLFDYPKVDVTAIDIASPHGFKPKTTPAPVKLETPYGRYVLDVTATPTGFHVDRAFALTVLIAKVNEYDRLKKFLDDVQKADRSKVTFERIGKGR